jgi:hypothetical protein
MDMTERIQAEDRVNAILKELTRGEKAILYKTLYAEGFKISDCDDIIRKAPASPPTTRVQNVVLNVKTQFHLSQGWPMNPPGCSPRNP